MRRGPGTVTANDIATRCSRYTPEPAPPQKEKNSLLCGGFSARVYGVDVCFRETHDGDVAIKRLLASATRLITSNIAFCDIVPYHSCLHVIIQTCTRRYPRQGSNLPQGL